MSSLAFRNHHPDEYSALVILGFHNEPESPVIVPWVETDPHPSQPTPRQLDTSLPKVPKAQSAQACGKRSLPPRRCLPQLDSGSLPGSFCARADPPPLPPRSSAPYRSAYAAAAGSSGLGYVSLKVAARGRGELWGPRALGGGGGVVGLAAAGPDVQVRPPAPGRGGPGARGEGGSGTRGSGAGLELCSQGLLRPEQASCGRPGVCFGELGDVGGGVQGDSGGGGGSADGPRPRPRSSSAPEASWAASASFRTFPFLRCDASVLVNSGVTPIPGEIIVKGVGARLIL